MNALPTCALGDHASGPVGNAGNSGAAHPSRTVRSVFGGGGTATKHKIATLVTEHFPELGHRLPSARKPWMSEDARFAIFGAVAFGLTYFLLGDTDTLAGQSSIKNAA